MPSSPAICKELWLTLAYTCYAYFKTELIAVLEEHKDVNDARLSDFVHIGLAYRLQADK